MNARTTHRDAGAFDLLVLCASIQGEAAALDVLRSLPRDFALPIVVMQPPDFGSRALEAYGACRTGPAEWITASSALAPGRLLLCPPGAADQVLPLSDIGQVVGEIASGRPRPESRPRPVGSARGVGGLEAIASPAARSRLLEAMLGSIRTSCTPSTASTASCTSTRPCRSASRRWAAPSPSTRSRARAPRCCGGCRWRA